MRLVDIVKFVVKTAIQLERVELEMGKYVSRVLRSLLKATQRDFSFFNAIYSDRIRIVSAVLNCKQFVRKSTKINYLFPINFLSESAILIFESVETMKSMFRPGVPVPVPFHTYN